MSGRGALDIDRCLRAMRHLAIEGAPRAGAITDAIAAIQADGQRALSTMFIGVKNYAHFGDQRADCEYGYGPKHGYIVFRIGRRGDRKVPLGPDEVYLLEATRDFGTIEGKTPDGRATLWNLCDVLERAARLRADLVALDAALAGTTVDSHEVVS